MAAPSSHQIAVEITARDNATRELQPVGAAIDGLKKKVDDLSFMAKTMQKVWSGVTDSIGNSIWGFAQKGIGIATDAVIGFNARQEQAMIGFTTMLGSADKAAGFMKELQDFAAATPFEFDGLRQSANLIMAMGFEAEEVIPLLTSAGDAVAALGLGTEAVQRVVYALGQMRAAGRVTGQDMMQLSSMGIPAWKMLADSMGLTVQEAKKLAESGQIDAETAIKAITTAINEGDMGGMMKAQARTFNGALSTIKDTAQLVIANAFKPLFTEVSAVAIAISDFLGSEGFLAWAANVGQQMGVVITAFVNFGKALAPIVAAFLPAAISILERMIGSFVTFGVVAATAGTIIAKMLRPIADLLGPIAPLLSGIAANFIMVSTAGMALAKLTAMMKGLAVSMGLVSAWGTLWRTAGVAVIAFSGIFSAFRVSFTVGMAAINAALGPIGWLTIAVSLLAAAFSTNFLGIGDMVKGVMDEVTRATNDFAMNFGDMGTRVHDIADRAGVDFDVMKDTINGIMQEQGVTFEEAAVKAEEQFHLISQSQDELVAESGAAWDTYQSQITVANQNADSAVRGFQGTILESMKTGAVRIVEVALRTPGDIARALLDGRSAVSAAAAQLTEAIEGRMDPIDEIAALQGQLAGGDLAKALKDKDPIVRASAQQLRQTITDRLSQLNAYAWGSSIAQAWANGVASQWGYAHAKAVYLGTSLSGPLKGESPPKEGPLRNIDRWGENVGQAWADGVVDSTLRGLSGLGDVFRGASLGGSIGVAGTGGNGIGGSVSAFASGGMAGGGVTIINNFGAGSVRSDDDIREISRRLALQVRMEGAA